MSKQELVDLATEIRMLTFNCKSKDVFSCEFGNEFGSRVEALLAEVLGVDK